MQSDPKTTAEDITSIADRVRAATNDFNVAVQEATRKGLFVQADLTQLQTMKGDCPVLVARVFEPR